MKKRYSDSPFVNVHDVNMVKNVMQDHVSLDVGTDPFPGSGDDIDSKGRTKEDKDSWKHMW